MKNFLSEVRRGVSDYVCDKTPEEITAQVDELINLSETNEQEA